MYDILFLSFLIPDELEADVRKKMSQTMDEAASAWQKKIIQGIEDNIASPISLMNYLPIKSYPQFYSAPFISKSVFSHTENAKDINLPFCNIKYIKRAFQGASVCREIKKWAVAKDGRKKIIVAYTLYPEYLKAIEIAKKMNPDIIAGAIVLDLPEYMVLTKHQSLYTRLFLRWNKAMADQHMGCLDTMVLLTEHMKAKLPINVPCGIIEGMYSSDIPSKEENNDGFKYIFYAGTLHERFGVMDLVEAFRQIPNENYRLVICGNGDCYDAIRKIAAHDARIVFKGQLKRDEALEEMSHATVIVNPRGNTEEFVKYSFPSKNIEALSSGIPFVGYKLAGIPDEYDAYINYPCNESKEALAKLLVDICEDEENLYTNKAMQAKEWVMREKNPRVQAKKVLALFDEVSNATR